MARRVSSASTTTVTSCGLVRFGTASQHKGEHHADAADDGEEACIGVHYRLSNWPELEC